MQAGPKTPPDHEGRFGGSSDGIGDIGPKLAALAVVVRGAEVLLVRRANPPQAGEWGFPGGKVESGETVLEAARRELREETGLTGGNARLLDVIDLIQPELSAPAPLGRGRPGRARLHHLMVAVRLDWLAGEPAPADDALELCWAEAAQLPGPLCADVARVARAAVKRAQGNTKLISS
ncbi:NUDIX hydrolase [Pelagibius litoralis]|uniref:NUDIX hydrolase n=1 Tax=Pelagibius litoralis TaxID=374515 RepID=UPI002AC31998|nr:NUDIX hydrolase [Pelagibius litoralis]